MDERERDALIQSVLFWELDLWRQRFLGLLQRRYGVEMPEIKELPAPQTKYLNDNLISLVKKYHPEWLEAWEGKDWDDVISELKFRLNFGSGANNRLESTPKNGV